METSRSDEQTSVRQTLGERMVMVARMMAAEHVRQVVDEAGVDLAEVQRQLRANPVRQDLFERRPTLAKPVMVEMPTPPRPALPQRVKARRVPPPMKGVTPAEVAAAAATGQPIKPRQPTSSSRRAA